MSKFLLFAAVVCLFISLPLKAEIDCPHKYRIVESVDIRVCSTAHLDRADLYWIRNTVLTVPKKYLAFKEESGVASSKTITLNRIDIAILDKKTLNDGTLPDGLSSNVVGRYYPGEKRVYVDIRSIKNKGSVLAHEIVHMINYMSGIVDADVDEALAYNFEAHIDDIQEN